MLRRFLCIQKTLGQNWKPRAQTKFLRPILAVQNPTFVRSFHDDLSFENASDETLESLCEKFEILIDENSKLSEADVTLSNGVLTIALPPHGTYVINKQSPNKQIWLSSPSSGPKRYDLVSSSWIYRYFHVKMILIEKLKFDIVFSISIPGTLKKVYTVY